MNDYNMTEENTEHISRSEIEFKCGINGPYIPKLYQMIEAAKSHPLKRYFKRSDIARMEAEVEKYLKIRELIGGKILALHFPITRFGMAVAQLGYDIEHPDGRIETDKSIPIDAYEVNAKYQKITLVFGYGRSGNSTACKVILPSRYLDIYKHDVERYINVRGLEEQRHE